MNILETWGQHTGVCGRGDEIASLTAYDEIFQRQNRPAWLVCDGRDMGGNAQRVARD